MRYPIRGGMLTEIPLPDRYDARGLSIIGLRGKASRAVVQRYIEGIRTKHVRTMNYNMKRILSSQRKEILALETDSTLEIARVLAEHVPWMRNVYENLYIKTTDDMYPLIQDGTLLKSYNRRERKDLTEEEIYRTHIRAWLSRNGGSMITRINDTTMMEIRSVLVNADTTAEVYRALDTYFSTNISSRAVRIAWTETSTATNVGSLECMRSVAVRESMKVWRTLQDNYVRDTHRAMDGSKVLLGERFDVPSKMGMDRMDCPGDPVGGSAGNVVNCRCMTFYEYV